MRQGHQGEIRLVHLAREASEHYLVEQAAALAARYAQLRFEGWVSAELAAALQAIRLPSRHTVALICGSPGSVECFSRRLFLAGLPRNQLFADVFVERG
ncbi:hypothetical protein D3C80_1978420 [compost metagenome]